MSEGERTPLMDASTHAHTHALPPTHAAPATPGRAAIGPDAAIWSAWEKFKDHIVHEIPHKSFEDARELVSRLGDAYILLAMARNAAQHTSTGNYKAMEAIVHGDGQTAISNRLLRLQTLLQQLGCPAAIIPDTETLAAPVRNRDELAKTVGFLVEQRFGDTDVTFKSPAGRHTRSTVASATPAAGSKYHPRYGHSSAVPSTPGTSSRSLAAAPMYAAAVHATQGAQPQGHAVVPQTPGRQHSGSIVSDAGIGGDGSAAKSSGWVKTLMNIVTGKSDEEAKILQLQSTVSTMIDELKAREERTSALMAAMKSAEAEAERQKRRVEEMQAKHAQEVEGTKAVISQLQGNYAQTKQDLEQAHADIMEAKAGYEANLQEMDAKLRSAREEVDTQSLRINELQSAIEAAAEQARAMAVQHTAALAAQAAQHEDALNAEEARIAERKEVEAMLQQQIELMREEATRQAGALKAVEESLRHAEQGRAAAEAAQAAAEELYTRRCVVLDARQREKDAKVAETLGVVAAFGVSVRALRADMAAALAQAQADFASAGKELLVQVANAERLTATANTRYVKEQAERRRLYNKLQETRGNIRVLARVRPLLPKEADAGEVGVVQALSPYELVVNEAASERAGGRIMDSKNFEFDHVFGSESTQQDVFDEVQPLVTSAMDGFHACIFAYGQTGSGKTFTMGGSAAQPGVYRRSLDELFAMRDERSSAYKYSIKVSMVEIYNENVMDLLADPTTRNTLAMEEEGAASLDIKQGPNGNFLPDANVVEVFGVDDVEAVMAKGALNRTVGRTNANEHSSRSHSLLMIDIYGHNVVSDARTFGRLVLVDLAGSERVSKSGAEGQRLKEAQNINKSLSSLGDVIQALVHKAPHVPFRNSKLTWLLADSLGKENKTLMIVQVSPVVTSRQETLCSLNFASRVRRVELGKASKHGDGVDGARVRAELKRLQETVRSHTTEMATLQDGLRSAQEGEAAAKARAMELQARVTRFESDAAAKDEACRENERLRTEVSKLTLALNDRSNTVEKLQAELRDASKSSKTAATAAADATIARMDAAVKRAVEDTEARMKIERGKAITEVEAKYKAELANLRKTLKEVQASEAKAKAEMAVADAKAKSDIQSILAAAKASWERDARRATISQARQRQSSAAFGRKMSIRKSVLPDAEDAAAATFDAETSAHDTSYASGAEDALNTSATSAAGSIAGDDVALPIDDTDVAEAAADVSAADVSITMADGEDTAVAAALDASAVLEPVEIAGETSITSEVFDGDAAATVPLTPMRTADAASALGGCTPFAFAEAAADAAAAGDVQPADVDDESMASGAASLADTGVIPVPAVALFGRLEDVGADENVATIAAAPAVAGGSRERARMLGLASPKPVGILRAKTAAGKSARVALLSPNTATVSYPGAATPARKRRSDDAAATAASSENAAPTGRGPATPARIARRAAPDATSDENACDARPAASFITGAGAIKTKPSAASKTFGARSNSASTTTSTATAASSRSAPASTAADSVDESVTADAGVDSAILRPASATGNVVAGLKVPAGMKLLPGAKLATRTPVAGIHSGAARVKAATSTQRVRAQSAAARGPARVSIHEATMRL